MLGTTIATWILLGSFAIMLILRIPITFALAASSIFTAMYLKIPLMVIIQQMVQGVNSFSLMAIPFFIIAGEIMGEGGISQRLIEFANVIVGRFRGGLALVNVLASTFFGGISGSAVADVSSIGAILIPMMKKQGYDTAILLQSDYKRMSRHYYSTKSQYDHIFSRRRWGFCGSFISGRLHPWDNTRDSIDDCELYNGC